MTVIDDMSMLINKIGNIDTNENEIARMFGTNG